jgi:hypothetical protein
MNYEQLNDENLAWLERFAGTCTVAARAVINELVRRVKTLEAELKRLKEQNGAQ